MSIIEVLNKTGQTESTVLREHLILTGLAKLSRYEAECALFEKKYGEALESFKERLNQKHQEEDFALEDDLMDWEFADAALKWWRSQIEELRHAG
ncbi:MAG: hypothetical protein H8D96_20375 [Desulfobacterales bacterium]|uniref:Uncharacterized protein n=1 Tax=Candidatus Desulfatibia vada TaxID=2841696 RepID=A0A8J6TWF7_9BACT|nr:hypothetical protein [Candidatus Desulfatibia vada]